MENLVGWQEFSRRVSADRGNSTTGSSLSYTGQLRAIGPHHEQSPRGRFHILDVLSGRPVNGGGYAPAALTLPTGPRASKWKASAMHHSSSADSHRMVRAQWVCLISCRFPFERASFPSFAKFARLPLGLLEVLQNTCRAVVFLLRTKSGVFRGATVMDDGLALDGPLHGAFRTFS